MFCHIILMNLATGRNTHILYSNIHRTGILTGTTAKAIGSHLFPALTTSYCLHKIASLERLLPKCRATIKTHSTCRTGVHFKGLQSFLRRQCGRCPQTPVAEQYQHQLCWKMQRAREGQNDKEGT